MQFPPECGRPFRDSEVLAGIIEVTGVSTSGGSRHGNHDIAECARVFLAKRGRRLVHHGTGTLHVRRGADHRPVHPLQQVQGY